MLLRGIESGAIKAHLAGRHAVAVELGSRPAHPQRAGLGDIDDIEDVIADFAKRNKPIARLVMTPSAFEPDARPESILMRARKLGVIVNRMPVARKR